MMKFITASEQILESMKRTIGATAPAAIAIAFWGRNATTEIGLSESASGTRVLLNADSGACNPHELRVLLEMPNVLVKNAPLLHAKVVIGHDRMVVGSANASANGLGFQGWPGWAEACVETSEPQVVEDAKEWFEMQWASAREELSADTILRAERAAERLQSHAAAVVRARRGTSDVATVEELSTRVFVVVTDESADFSAAHRRKMANSLGFKESARIDYYQDWPTIPTNALLISINADKRSRKVWFDDYWLSSDGRSVPVPGVGRGYPVTKATERDLREWGLARKIHWKECVASVVELFHEKKRLGRQMSRGSSRIIQYRRCTDWCMPLSETLRICVDHGLSVPAPWSMPLPDTAYRTASEK